MPAIQSIRQLVAEAIADKSNNRKWHIIGEVLPGDAAMILAKTGIDVSGFTRMLDVSAIIHTLNMHGDEAAEKAIGQLPVIASDFEKIPLIVQSMNVIYGSVNRRGLATIIYEKKFLDTYFYVEEVRNQHKKLALNTMWKR